MFYTYVLKNPIDKLYIGYTNNLKKRLHQHNTGQVYTTKRIGGSWHLVYYEACINELDAKKRERFLKSTHGKEFLTERLKFYLKDN